MRAVDQIQTTRGKVVIQQWHSYNGLNLKTNEYIKERIYKTMKRKASKTIFNISFTLCKIFVLEVSVSEKLLLLYFRYLQMINS